MSQPAYQLDYDVTESPRPEKLRMTGGDAFLKPGSFFWGSAPARVGTLLGSCVSITLWHPVLRIGGMCHYLTANPRTSTTPLPEVQYETGLHARGAIELFLERIQRAGTRPYEYEAKLFGGGVMLPNLVRPKQCGGACSVEDMSRCTNVSCRNVRMGRDLLLEHGFPIAAQNVGGYGSRHLLFDLATGAVWLRFRESSEGKARRAAEGAANSMTND